MPICHLKARQGLDISAGDKIVSRSSGVMPIERIEQAIYLIRGQRVMLDNDLAKIYGVPTKRLKEQVRRNSDRFPRDFMFPLTLQEIMNLRSQFATSSSGWGGARYLPMAFTEHGAIMLANVLNSPKAVKASIAVVRAFVRLRETLALHKELAVKLNELERKIAHHDENIRTLFEAIRHLMTPPEKPRRRIGFGVGESRARYRLFIQRR